MKRLWYVRILKRGRRFVARIFNVFDNCEPEKPIEVDLADLAAVALLIRAFEPVSHVAQIYMDVNGQGALLRVSMLPIQPLEELERRAVEDLESLEGATGLSTAFLTRSEILQRLRLFRKAQEDRNES